MIHVQKVTNAMLNLKSYSWWWSNHYDYDINF